MSLAIFLAYMDYCKEHSITPNIEELLKWKIKYNNR